jgi:O-acetyl-ADP-ribose deacetylase (regulator of RNase III)
MTAVTPITYVKGDATNPLGAGPKIICHCCNDQGKWGKGFVLALARKWPEPEEQYHRWRREGDNFALGEIQMVQVAADIWVANMIGQHGTRLGRSGPPIRYEAIRACLEKRTAEVYKLSASLHMPRIGCGLAGGTWEQVEPLIQETLCRANVSVTVYDWDSRMAASAPPTRQVRRNAGPA